jgi:hypothetical protein
MPSLERSSALPQPHPRNWLVNAWQKPKDSFTRTQMYPLLCHPYLILLISIVQSVCTKTGCHCSPRLECKPESTAGLLLSSHSRKLYCCLVSSVVQTQSVSGMRSLMCYCLLTLLHFEVVQLGGWDDCSACVRLPSFQGKLRYAFTFYQYLSFVCNISVSECTRRGTIYYKES